MSNFPSFLDSSGGGMGQNVPRQAPSPNQPSHQLNGSGSMPMVNGLPSGGTQTDMTHLWNVVQQLSDILAENRAQTQGIVNGVQQIHARAAQEGTQPTLAQVNGELNASRGAEISSLQAQNSSLQRRATYLEGQNESLVDLLQHYEQSMSTILEKLRPYAYNHQQAILSIHANYNAMIERERQEKLELSIEHANWQAGLRNVAKHARLALRAQNEESLPYIAKIRELKKENRTLRKLQGWDPPSDSSDDESDNERRRDHEQSQ